VLLGWESRAQLGPHVEGIVAGGMFQPFALVKGRVAARWRLAKKEVEVEPLGRLSRTDRAALEADAADVTRFLDAATGR
jgi:hypothetical protein